MTLRITPTRAPVGAYVTGFDIDDLSKAEASALYQAFLEYGVLIFTELDLDVAVHVKLAGLFGKLCGPHPIQEMRHEQEPSITVLNANGGKVVAQGDPAGDDWIGTIPWHADRIYTDMPNRGALLRAIVIPEEAGQTGWIDTARVYRMLPDRIKSRLQGLRIIHSYSYSHSRQTMVGGKPTDLPDSIHPLVFVHPETDMPMLNIGPNTARELVGLPAEEGAELLQYLVDLSTREEDAYIHEWKTGDLIAWDNYRAIHRAYGHARRYPRVMHSLALDGHMKLGEIIHHGTLDNHRAAV